MNISQTEQEQILDSGTMIESPLNIHIDVKYRKLNGFFADYIRYIKNDIFFIQTQSSLPVGSHVDFDLHSPHLTSPLRIQAQVIAMTYANQDEQHHASTMLDGMTLKFIYPDETSKNALKKSIENLLKNELGEYIFTLMQSINATE